jgi:NAD(P)-dependent dehydrogenase (short-subunit alcohol dehydrogenase family)
MSFSGKKVMITGGSRGLGRALTEALLGENANVIVVARNASELVELKKSHKVEVAAVDIIDQPAAIATLQYWQPDLLILNAGALPPMAPFHESSWDEFTATWDTDVKGGLFWMQAALNLPLRPGSQVIVSSSGAAVQGSPMSGGYAGAKRMLWLMCKYANGISEAKNLGIQFQAIVPTQMIRGTGIGDAGAAAYAAALGVTSDQFLDRFPEMSSQQYGGLVVEALKDDRYRSALALGFNGESGISVLEATVAPTAEGAE